MLWKLLNWKEFKKFRQELWMKNYKQIGTPKEELKHESGTLHPATWKLIFLKNKQRIEAKKIGLLTPITGCSADQQTKLSDSRTEKSYTDCGNNLEKLISTTKEEIWMIEEPT